MANVRHLTDQDIGTTTLIGGTKAVSDAAIQSTSKVFVTNNGIGGTIGIMSVVLNAGVGFTINSTNILDTSTVHYLVIH